MSILFFIEEITIIFKILIKKIIPNKKLNKVKKIPRLERVAKK